MPIKPPKKPASKAKAKKVVKPSAPKKPVKTAKQIAIDAINARALKKAKVSGVKKTTVKAKKVKKPAKDKYSIKDDDDFDQGPFYDKAKASEPEYGDDADDITETGELTGKAERFCNEYIIDFNGTQAARRSGYAPRSAHVAASRLLNNDKVVNRLKVLKQPEFARHKITRAKIMDEIAAVAFHNIGDFLEYDELGQAYIKLTGVPREKMRAIEGIEFVELPPITQVIDGQETSREVLKVKIKSWNKLDALNMLAKRYGLIKEAPASGPTINVNVDLKSLAQKMAFVLASSKASKPTK